MKNVINCAHEAMKNLFVLAISALLVANVSAQEQKKECCKGKQPSKEEFVEFEIKRLSHELYLSDEQAQKFAVTYREYAAKLDELFSKNAPKEDFEPGKELTDKELDKLAKQRFEGMKNLVELQSKYYDKFRKNLSARQVEKVFRFKEPFGPKGFDGKPCCGKHEGKHAGPKGFNHEGKKCGKHCGPRPDFKEDFKEESRPEVKQ